MAPPSVPAPTEVPVRVLVADDSFLIREGLRQLLAMSPAVRVVGAYADMPGLLAAVDAAPPDVVITDIRMPPTQTDEGLKIAERLRHSHPAVGVVLLSQFDHAQYAARLLSDGAAGRGYLLKDRIHDLEHMVSVIVGTAHGECRIDSDLIDSLLARKRARQHSPLTQLTPRQIEILADVAMGKSNQRIADEQTLTLRAIEKHISQIFSRLGLDGEEAMSKRVRATLLYLEQAAE